MVQIITDSAADFESWELKEMNIDCIPLTVAFGSKEYRDGTSLSKEQFYQLLLESQDLPQTAQASPKVLMDLFENAHKNGDDAVYICLSSALSGTCQTAMMTKNLLDHDTCYVVDGRNATGGQRMLVEYAVRMRDEGKTGAEIVEAVEAFRDKIVLFACIDTLEYLYKGGRISHTVYKLGTLANIKPIITVDADGHIQVPAKAMGMRKGMDQLCKQLTKRKPDRNFPLYVMYTNNKDVARELCKYLEAAGWQIPEERIIQVGAAIGTHIGPDACGLVYAAE